MKRIICMILCLAALLCACQKTPEEPIVIGKHNDGWKEEEIPAEEPVEIGVPEWYEAELQFKDISIDIDAAVDVPEDQLYPVYVLERTTFSQELADKVMNALIGDAELYQVQNGRTKQMIQQEIDYYTRELNYEGNSEEHQQFYQEIMKELIAEKETAPEAEERTAASREIGYVYASDLATKYGREMETEDGGKMYIMTESTRKKAEADGNVGIHGNCTLENGEERTFLLKNRPRGNSSMSFGDRDDMPIVIKDGSLAEEDALAIGKDFMDQLGIDYKYVGYEMPVEGKDYYKLIYASAYPELDALPAAVTTPAPTSSEQRQFSPPVVQEEIHVFVNCDGIYGFWWYAPQKLAEIEQENTKLLPWTDVAEIIEKSLEVKSAWMDPDEQVISRRLDIDKIVLSYMNVRKESDFSSTYYVPVWDVIGTMTYQYPDDYSPENGGYILDENNERIAYENCSVLTVNAIDGTIIDRGMGY